MTLAADAFMYGFPLVFDLQQVNRFVNEGMGAVPPSPLRPILRLYEPDDAVFDGGYELPPITRLDSAAGGS